MVQSAWESFIQGRRLMIPIISDPDYDAAVREVDDLIVNGVVDTEQQAYLDFQAAMIQAYSEGNETDERATVEPSPRLPRCDPAGESPSNRRRARLLFG